VPVVRHNHNCKDAMLLFMGGVKQGCVPAE